MIDACSGGVWGSQYDCLGTTYHVADHPEIDPRKFRHRECITVMEDFHLDHGVEVQGPGPHVVP